MSFKQYLEKQLIKFGKNNSPTLVAITIASAKGIFRPAFTMMDKKESAETKRYTAIREGLTEVIAIPVYYLSGVISNKISEKLAVPKNFMSKSVYKKYKNGDNTLEIKNAVKHAEELAKINLPKIKTNTSFIGVCISALFIIPYICSATLKPIMKYLNSENLRTDIEQDKPVSYAKIQEPIKCVNAFKSIYRNFNNYDMKVGAL